MDLTKEELSELLKEIKEDEKLSKVNNFYKDPIKIRNYFGWLAVAFIYTLLIAVVVGFFGNASIEALNEENRNLQAEIDQGFVYYKEEQEKLRTVLKTLDCEGLKKIYALDIGYEQTISKLLIVNSCN